VERTYSLIIIINYEDTDKQIDCIGIPWEIVLMNISKIKEVETEATSFVFTIVPL